MRATAFCRLVVCDNGRLSHALRATQNPPLGGTCLTGTGHSSGALADVDPSEMAEAAG
jgi:hypothetical protein